jgi:hypothetical protein
LRGTIIKVAVRISRSVSGARRWYARLPRARQRVVFALSALAAGMLSGVVVLGVVALAVGPAFFATSFDQDESAAVSTPWQALGPSGDAFTRWDNAQLRLAWRGSCETGPITAELGPQNWGYFSEPIGGVAGISASVGGVFCDGAEIGVEADIVSAPVGSWKCYGFTAAWVSITGDTDDAGVHKISMPTGISQRSCPNGAEINDPTAVWWRTLQMGLVPGFSGRPNYSLTANSGPVAEPSVSESPTPTPAATRTSTATPSPSTARPNVPSPSQAIVTPSPSSLPSLSPSASPSPSETPTPSESAIPSPSTSPAPSPSDSDAE